MKRWTLVVVCAAAAMLTLDLAVVNTALSSIASELHTGLSGLQWVIDAYTLALSTAVLSAGALADRFGRRRAFMLGLAVFTLGSLGCAAAGDIGVLSAARGLQGVGAAGMFAVSLALLAHAYPGRRERAGALAAFGAVAGASLAVGPLVGGLLTSGLDWRWIFLMNVPIGIACLAMTRAYVQESRDPRGHGVDWPGQATLAAGLFLLVLALLRGHDQGWTSTLTLAQFTAAAAAMCAFLIIEHRTQHPMLPLPVFRSGAFTCAQLGVFAMAGSFFALFLYTTVYLQGVLGLSPIRAGLAYLPGTALMALVSGATGRVGPRVPARLLVAAGLALAAAGLVLFTLAGSDSHWTMVLPGELIVLAGVGLFNPAVMAVALGSLPSEQSGVAAGASAMFRIGGLAVGVAALGALIPAQHVLGGGDAAAYVAGYHHALLAGAAVAATGAVAAWALIPGAKARSLPTGLRSAAAHTVPEAA